jgi:hypothetical protein
LGTVAFGAVTPLPVVFGVAGPAPWRPGLPGAVAPGLPPAPPVWASAAVVTSAADSTATGIKNRADIIGSFRSSEFHDVLIRAQSSSCRIAPDEHGSDFRPAPAEAGDVADAGT